ncbi:MAG: ABC transporter ATP-binding protein/permease [Pseudomonadota bacterium]
MQRFSPRLIGHIDPVTSWAPARKLLPYLWRYRGRVLVGMGFLVLARFANVGVPLILKQIVDQLESASIEFLVVPLALLLAYGALRLLSIFFNELRNVVFARASVEIIHSLSSAVFEHLHRLSLRFHLDRKIGGLSRDVERGSMAISGFLRIVVFSILPIILEIALLLIVLGNQFDQRFVWITIGMIVIYAVFTFAVTRWRTQFRVQMNEAESKANTRALDSLINYETVKVFGNERLEHNRYQHTLSDWVGASMKSTTSLAWLNSGQGLIVVVGLTMLMFLAAEGVVTESLSLGDFVMLNAFLIQLYIPLNFLGSVYRDLNHSLIDMERMFELLEEVPDVQDVPDAKVLDLDSGEIEFKNVSFSYQSEQPILNDVSFVVSGGQMVAVVGPSGAGKSTLSRLLLRFYDPDAGSICIDGQNIEHVTLDSLRAAMAVVPQDTVLFNDTIGYNIGYGNPGAGVDEIKAAAKVAQIDQFIDRHPDGYDVLVGERGLKLSGGEKQRVAIARAALKGAQILIFDEATSSLDSRSEQAIQAALDNIAQNRTTLVIAHRLSTIVHADTILVMERGRIAERGTHPELMDRNGLYAQLWRLQQKDSGSAAFE